MRNANDNGEAIDRLLRRLRHVRDAMGNDWSLPFRMEVFNTIEEAIATIERLRPQAAVNRPVSLIGRLRTRLRAFGTTKRIGR